MPHRRLAFIVLAPVFLHIDLAGGAAVATSQTVPRPTISNVAILTPAVAQYEKFELKFDVETVSTFVNLPYDANPPAGLRPEMGISYEPETGRY